MAISPPTFTLDRPVAEPETPTLPRLLHGIRPDGAMSLSEHLALHGALPIVRPGGRRRGREQAGAFIGELEQSGLVGRGGAGFPAATKMRAVAAAKGRAIVVANGCEGEPASQKDRTLLQMLPHLIIDGAVIAAEAVGADRVIVAVCESSPESLDAVTAALARTRRRVEHSPKISVAEVPSHYSAGQESALVELPRRRALAADLHASSRLRTGHLAAPDAGKQRRDARPYRPHLSTRRALVPPARHPGPARVDAGDAVGPRAPPRGLRGRDGRLAHLPHRRGRRRHRAHAGSADRRLRRDMDRRRVPARRRALKRTSGASRRQPRGGCRAPALRGGMPGRGNGAGGAMDVPTRARGSAAPASTAWRRSPSVLEEITAGMAPARAGQRISRLGALTARRGACAHPDGAVRMILSGVEAFEPRVRRPCPPRPLRAVRALAGALVPPPPAEHARAARERGAPMSRRVRVNPITCEAHGMCAELLPERITLDEWGYPIVDGTPLQGSRDRPCDPCCPCLPHLCAAGRQRARLSVRRALRREHVLGGKARPASVGRKELAHLLLGSPGGGSPPPSACRRASAARGRPLGPGRACPGR